MAMQFRILNGKLIELGIVKEFSETSSTVIYTMSGSLDVHAEVVSLDLSNICEDDDRKDQDSSQHWDFIWLGTYGSWKYQKVRSNSNPGGYHSS